MFNDYDFYVELPSAKWIENDTIGDLKTKIFEKSEKTMNLHIQQKTKS